MRRAQKTVLLLVTLWPAVSGNLVAAGEPSTVKYFRSDGGIASNSGPLPDDLNPPEALRWRVEVDSGHSTPVIVNGKIFLTTYNEAVPELATVALDEATG